MAGAQIMTVAADAGRPDAEPVGIPVLPRTVVTPFTIVFVLIALQNLVSYPLHLISPSYLYSYVEDNVGDPAGVCTAAFLATVASFFLLLVQYSGFGSRKAVAAFVREPTLTPDDERLRKQWRRSAVRVLMCCGIAFVQAGFSLPLLQAAQLESQDYNIYRQETESAVSATLMNVPLYFLLPHLILTSFVAMRERVWLYRVGTVLLFGSTALFLLARSSIALPVIIGLLALAAWRPLRPQAMVLPSALVLLLIGAMMLASTKSMVTVHETFITRAIHGQWVGLPLYIDKFADNPVPLVSLLHPALRNKLGAEGLEAPGRQLMREINPVGVENGSAGNVPTYYLGEAIALGSWPMAAIGTLLVGTMIALFVSAFTHIPKTPFSCLVFGVGAFKIFTSITNGLSGFFLSGTTLLILLCLVWASLARSALRRQAQVEPAPTPTSTPTDA